MSFNRKYKVIQHISLMDKQPRNLTTYEKIMNTGFNMRFSLLALFDAYDKASIAKPGDTISILGQQLQIDKENTQQQNQLLFSLFSQIPWLTYRAGFPELYHDLKGTYITDTGWGCMIRVGQMAFAQLIRRHRKIQSSEGMPQIMELFNDFDGSQPFSIQKISKLARKQFGVLPGDWYNPSQISHILSIINQTNLQSKLKLSFLVFNSGNLFYDQIVEVMMDGKPITQCNCATKANQIVCSSCNRSQLSLGLIILARIGLNSPETKYLPVLRQMMKIPAFSGVIGGRPGKALYLIGTHGEDAYIYLDPHYVQTAEKNTKEILQSYFCSSFRICKATSIDPSFGLCYYFRDLNQLNTFYQDINECKKKYEGEFFVWASETTPQYLSKSIRLSKTIQVQEDYYQPL